MPAGVVVAVEAPAQVVEHLDEPGDRLDRTRRQQRDLPLRRVAQGLRETDPALLGVDHDARLGPVADSAPRGVEDTPDRHRVVRVVQHLEVGDHVAHLLTLVEARTADDLVRQAEADEHVLDHAGRVVGPVEHRDVGVRGLPRVHQPVDLPGDEPRLVVLVVRDVPHQQLAGALGGPQVLLAPPGVPRDHGVGGRQDGLRGAVVLLQQDGTGVRVVVLEVLDVPDRGPAERVDRLIRVTHHTEFGRGDAHLVVVGRRAAHEGADQDVLRVVGVLVLVHHDVAEPPPVVRGDLRVRA